MIKREFYIFSSVVAMDKQKCLLKSAHKPKIELGNDDIFTDTKKTVLVVRDLIKRYERFMYCGRKTLI